MTSYTHFGAAQFAQYKPLWMLRWEARLSTSNLADAALAEMIDRFKAGQLSSATAEQLLDDAVAHGPAGSTALVNAPVGSRWDALAAELMLAGHGSDAEREAIARSWVELGLALRAQVRHGETVPADITRRTLGPASPHGAYFQFRNGLLRINGEEYGLSMNFGSGGGSYTRGGGGGQSSSGVSLRPGSALPPDLKLGLHEFEVEFEVTSHNAYQGAVWAQWTHTLSGRFEYVGGEGDPVTLRRDAAMASAIEAGTTLENNQIEVTGYGSRTRLEFEGVTGPIAYQLYLQRGEQRWPHAQIATTLVGLNTYGTGGEVPDELEDGEVVDLVFVPDPDVARKTVDLTEILDHEFVIRGVKIVRPTTP